MVLLLNIAFPIWGVGTGFPGLSSPPADGEEAALLPSRQRAISVGAGCAPVPVIASGAGMDPDPGLC